MCSCFLWDDKTQCQFSQMQWQYERLVYCRWWQLIDVDTSWLICVLATTNCYRLWLCVQTSTVVFHDNCTINIVLLLLLLFIAYYWLFTAQAFVARDPRFDDLSGEFNESYFKQSYGFLSDIKLREKQVFVVLPFVFYFVCKLLKH